MDESYESSEKSALDDGCGLCDLKDLAQCALVNRDWYMAVQDVLYHSVRIDAVHFCPREDYLSDQRAKKKIEQGSVAPMRLKLFQQTMRHRTDIAGSVLFVKLPYMVVETQQEELARTVAVLPNLRYVDLPDSVFKANNESMGLRIELQERCANLRKMTYTKGAEAAFEAYAHQNLGAQATANSKQQSRWLWPRLEILELDELAIDLAVFRYVLSTSPALRELTLRSVEHLDDTAFQSTPNLPDFPPLKTLRFRGALGVTARGLQAYVLRPEVSRALSSLSLTQTSVTIPTLHLVLEQTSHLIHLSVTEEVSSNFPLDPVPPLVCPSLRTLNFEVTPSAEYSTRSGLTVPSDSHYAYLASSLHANGLPSLRKLYVRHGQFPQLLLMTSSAPNKSFNPRMSMLPPANSSAPPLPSVPKPRGRPGTFNQPLAIYAKDSNDLEWAFTSLSLSDGIQGVVSQPHSNGHDRLAPPSAPFAAGARPGSAGSGSGRRGSASSMGRPVSAYYASQSTLGPQWDGEARKSVFMGNGQGGFLAVPNGEQASGGSVEEDFPAPRRPWADGSNGRPGSSNGRPGSSGGLGSKLGLGHKSKPSRGLWR